MSTCWSKVCARIRIWNDSRRQRRVLRFLFKQQYGLILWQRYGYERVLRSEEHTLDVVRYILANPIRAGLAKNLNEYPFSGSRVFSSEQLMDGLQMESG